MRRSGVQRYFDDRIHHLPPTEMLKRSQKQSALEGGNNIGNDDNQAGVEVDLAEDEDEILAIVRHERPLFSRDSLGETPIRPATEAEVIDMCSGKACVLSDSNQRQMETLVYEKPQTCPNRDVSEVPATAITLPLRDRRRAGRPRRGNARMYNGAIAIL